MLKEALATSAFITAALKCGGKNCVNTEHMKYLLGQYVCISKIWEEANIKNKNWIIPFRQDALDNNPFCKYEKYNFTLHYRGD